MSQTFISLVQQSPLTDSEKQHFIQKAQDDGETSELILEFQGAVTSALDQVIASFDELQNPNISALVQTAQNNIENGDRKSVATLTRLTADTKDLLLDTQQYQQDLQAAIEETEKMSTGE
jgi:hypothetical protein